jgi:hypothetical protein
MEPVEFLRHFRREVFLTADDEAKIWLDFAAWPAGS